MEIDLGELTFYWRAAETNVPDPEIPVFLPYILSFDIKTGLFKQKKNQSTLDALETAYSRGYNIGYLQEGNSLNNDYGNSFLNFLEKYLPEKNSSILEIGCGACFLLERLKKSSFNVTGIDPSPIAEKAANKKNINFIQSFYKHGIIKNSFDCIYHHNVLEHVFDINNFLKSNIHNLNDGGNLIIGVPDCQESIDYGDLSMIWHEHISYFDQSSLYSVLDQLGLVDIKVEQSSYGGMLYAKGTKSVPNNNSYNNNVEIIKSKFENYKNKLSYNLNIIEEQIKTSLKYSKQLGIYIPLRFINYLSTLNFSKNDLNRIRFFDDDISSQGKYYDGFDIKIESFQDLIKNPPETVFICSYKFASSISKKIKSNIKKPIVIYTLKELLQISD